MIRAFIGTSLIEYPGRISSVVFTGGCNLHCPFCHNPELVRPDVLSGQFSIPREEVLEALSAREGFVEAVTITGGEPLVCDGLAELVAAIRERTGLLLKLDTNGTLPGRLGELLPMVDFVAMDVKASPEGYPVAVGGADVWERVLESALMVRRLPGHELRTTMVPGIVDADDVVELGRLLAPVGRWVLQQFRSGKTLSEEMRDIIPYPLDYLEETAEALSPYAADVSVRA